MSTHTLCVFTDRPELVPSESRIEKQDEREHITRSVANIYGVKHGRHARFFGSQPVSIERADLVNFGEHPYFVGLKSDGVRYLLLLTLLDGEPCAVMINRAMQMYEVEVWAPHEFFKEQSLFDGELVWEQRGGQLGLLYLVFDVIRAKSSMTQLPFSKRLTEVHRHILAELPAQVKFDGDERVGNFILDEHKIFMATPSIRMAPKRFVPFDQAASLWANRLSNAHKNDGLIFVRDGHPVQTGTDRSTYKWKPSSSISVDVCTRDGNIILTDKGAPVVFSTLLVNGKEYTLRLEHNELMQCLGNVTASTVIECLCKFEEKSIVFVPSKTRPDKSTCNAVNTVIKTLNNVCEAITDKELFSPDSRVRRTRASVKRERC